MADRIKGIEVEIGGDTKGLNKALSNLNKDINGTQKELKDVERLLKLDPKNTDLLRQKQQLLGDAIKETKNKVDSLKKAKEKADKDMAEGTEVNQEQYRKLQREIFAGEKSLKSLETQADNSKFSLEKTAAAAQKVSDNLSKAADKTKGLSIAAGGVLTAAGGLAYNAVTSADDLNTLAKQTGFATDELQKMQYAADLIDVPVDTITGAAKKMKKNMVSTSKETIAAWDAIGVSVTDANGNLRDSTTIFYEALEGLSGISNETERDTLAMQLFGKSADELAGVVDDGGAALKSLGKEAENAGVILSQDTLDSLNVTNDAIDTLKAQATGTFAEIGAEIATMLAPFLQNLAEKIKSVLGWIRSLDQDQLKTIGTILLVVAAISPVLSILSKVVLLIKGASAVVGTVSGAIAIFTGAATTGTTAATALAGAIAFITSPIGIVIAIIAALVVTLVVLWNKCEGFRNWVIGSAKWIKQAVLDSVEWIKQALKDCASFFIGIGNNILTGIEWIVNKAIDAVNSGIQRINTMLSGISSVLSFVGINVDWNIPSVPSVSIPRIPMLAKGGTFSSGSAIVGDAGPELLTLSNGAATVTPLSGGKGGASVNFTANFYGDYKHSDGMAAVRDLNRQLGRLYG